MTFTPSNHPLRGTPVERSTIERMLQVVAQVQQATSTIDMTKTVNTERRAA